jgi:hypothetical protein
VLCNYTGTDGRRYLDYRDVATGLVLDVTPGGGPYDIEVISGQAGGLLLPPGDDRWAVPDLPPDFAADLEPAAPVTPEAGGSPAEEE